MLAVQGPNLETRAEYRYLKKYGCRCRRHVDRTGSHCGELSRHSGLCTFSVLTDDCDPDNLKAANIEEIIAIAKEAEKDLTCPLQGT